jgi:nucleotide-binding universal stress UspA family protein
MYKKILVAVDGSDHALNAVRSAVKIARGSGATLYLLAVDGCRPLKGPLAELAKDEDLSRDEIFERVLESAAITAKIPDTIHVEQLVRIGDPADIILAEAGKIEADIIVVGRRGLGAYAELLLGSISRKVLHLAKVPVLVVNI